MTEESNTNAPDKVQQSPDSSGQQAAVPESATRPGSNTHQKLQPRRGMLSIAGETIRYIERAEKDPSINIRQNDKRSMIFMALCFATCALFGVLYMANPNLRPVCIILALAADFFLGMSILWYVLLRFGVLRSVEPRHALISWQLVLGAGAMFAFYTMNVALAFFTIYSCNPPPPPTESPQAVQSFE